MKTLKDISKIDDKLTKIYENQVTTVDTSSYVDRSEDLLNQMNFIILYLQK